MKYGRLQAQDAGPNETGAGPAPLKFTIKINGDKDYDLKNPGADEKTSRNYSLPEQR